MNKVIPILFVLGFVWVPFTSVPAVGIFFADGGWKERDILSLAALAGFWVWFGWGWHCLTGRFPFVSVRAFWSISLLVHLVWLGILWGTLLNLIWIVPNLIVAFVGMFPEQREYGWKQKVANLAAYGIPLAMAGVAVVAYAEDIQRHLDGGHVWLFAIAAVALLITACYVPHHSNE